MVASFENMANSKIPIENSENGRYSGSGRPNAVEHIAAESRGDEQVERIADAHRITRPIVRKELCARKQHTPQMRLVLSAFIPYKDLFSCPDNFGMHQNKMFAPQNKI